MPIQFMNRFDLLYVVAALLAMAYMYYNTII